MLQETRPRRNARAIAASAGALVLAFAGIMPRAEAAEAPQISVSANPDVAMVYHWSIANKPTKSSLGTVQAGAHLSASYTVVATPGHYDYERAAIVGEISLTNPNTTNAMNAEVTVHASDAAWACQAATATSSVQPGATATVAYDCMLSGDAEPQQAGTVEVSVAWSLDGESATTKASADYSLNPTETNRSITIEHLLDGGAPTKLGTATWNPDGAPVTFQDTRQFPASKKPGKHSVTNSARIVGTGEQAAATVTYTVEEPAPSPSPDDSATPEPPEVDVAPTPEATPSETGREDPRRPKRPTPGMPPSGV